MQVYKFGGLSLKDAVGIKNVTEIILRHRKENLIVIVSAIGKNTRLLCKYAESCFADSAEKEKSYLDFQKNHVEILNELNIREKDEGYDQIMDCILKTGNIRMDSNFERFSDQVISNGELVSSMILSSYLKKTGTDNQWIDIREVLKTDNHYSQAHVNHEESLVNAKNIFGKQKGIIISQGFIGRSEEGFTSTLGFEGSDYTATLIGNYLDAEKVIIWKDVPGIMNADPGKYPDAMKIDRISYEDILNYAHAGAKVLHPKSIKPARNKNIPLEVKSYRNPQLAGSLIDEKGSEIKPPVIIVKKDQAYLRIKCRDFSFILEDHLNEIIKLMHKLNISVNLININAISVEFSVDRHDLKIKKLQEEVGKSFQLYLKEKLELWNFFNLPDKSIRDKMDGKKEFIRIQSGKNCRILCSSNQNELNI